MKSKKAEEYIDKKKREDYPGGYLCYTLSEENAKKAVEIAEEEMKEKAIEAHLNTCPHLYDRNCDISENGMCEYRSGGKCKYMIEFINELNK